MHITILCEQHCTRKAGLIKCRASESVIPECETRCTAAARLSSGLHLGTSASAVQAAMFQPDGIRNKDTFHVHRAHLQLNTALLDKLSTQLERRWVARAYFQLSCDVAVEAYTVTSNFFFLI